MKKDNIKLIVGIVLGSLLSFTTAHAMQEIAFNSNIVLYNNTNSHLISTTVQNAIDELHDLYEQAVAPPPTCTSSPFQIGDYVDMTPTSTSFTPDRTLTGLVNYDAEEGKPAGTTAVAGTLNPSYLNVWRVIQINSDCTVEIVSVYASNVKVKFAGRVGYANYVYYLNEIAKQYANTTYTLDPATAPDGAFRNIGYDHQTKQITDMTMLNATTVPWQSITKSENDMESIGGGDYQYTRDILLLKEANVQLGTQGKGSTIPTSFSTTTYWMVGRWYYGSTNAWTFYVNTCDSSGWIGRVRLLFWENSSYQRAVESYAIRPIVTLKSGLTPTGSGTAANHYVLN